MTQLIDVSQLRAASRNANVMNDFLVASLVTNLRAAKENGEELAQPLLVRPLRRPPNPDGSPLLASGDLYEVVDGHHRWRAAVEVGYEKLPCVVRMMSDDEAARAAIAMNRIRGELDLSIVGDIFADLADAGIDPDLLEACGFKQEEVDALIAASTDHPDEEKPEAIERPAPPDKTEEKETWELELSFNDQTERDRARRHLRKLGEGDATRGLIALLVKVDDTLDLYEATLGSILGALDDALIEVLAETKKTPKAMAKLARVVRKAAKDAGLHPKRKRN